MGQARAALEGTTHRQHLNSQPASIDPQTTGNRPHHKRQALDILATHAFAPLWESRRF
jgi:hypothetical protein